MTLLFSDFEVWLDEKEVSETESEARGIDLIQCSDQAERDRSLSNGEFFREIGQRPGLRFPRATPSDYRMPKLERAA
jgi:hypothetical protein